MKREPVRDRSGLYLGNGQADAGRVIVCRLYKKLSTGALPEAICTRIDWKNVEPATPDILRNGAAAEYLLDLRVLAGLAYDGPR